MNNKTKKICIYHGNCNDGFGAALAVETAHPNEDIKFYPANYNEPFPDVYGKSVIIVDFSYPRDVLIDLASQAVDVLILDHHATAKDQLVNLPENVTAVFDMNRSGAMMAWEWFHDEPAPLLIEAIQDRDLWRFNEEDTKEIYFGLSTLQMDFFHWRQYLVDENLKDLISDGSAVLTSHYKNIETHIKSCQHRAVIAGHDVPVLNAPKVFSSDAGEIMGVGEKFAATYIEDGTHRHYSLRSENKDYHVGNIAALFGGGGHAGAAGFKVLLADVPSVPHVGKFKS